MNGTQLREAIVDSRADELDALGSERLIVALSGGDPERRAVLRAAADSEHAARNTFREWAADETDPAARDAFRSVARQEDDHRSRVLDLLAESYDPVDGGPLHTYLRGRTDTIERIAAGMVGRPLVSSHTHERVIAFLQTCGDDAGAACFRTLRSETADVADDGIDLLDERCNSRDDWERARMVAEYAIQVAYDDYADAIAGLD